MLTLPHLERLARARQWERLLRDVGLNGRPMVEQFRARLASAPDLAAVTLGLAAQRGRELVRGGPRSRDRGIWLGLVRGLLAGEAADRGFDSVVAAAIAWRALAEAEPELGRDAPEHAGRLEIVRVAAADHVREALDEAESGRGPIDGTAWRIVLWQLARCPRRDSRIDLDRIRRLITRDGSHIAALPEIRRLEAAA